MSYCRYWPLSLGPDKGAYYHELFQRGKGELAKHIRQTKGGGKRGRKPQATEPSFHDVHADAPSPSQDNVQWPGGSDIARLPTGIAEAHTFDASSALRQPIQSPTQARLLQLVSGGLDGSLPEGLEPAALTPGPAWGNLEAGVGTVQGNNLMLDLRGQNVMGQTRDRSQSGLAPAAARKANQSFHQAMDERQLEVNIQLHSQQLQAQLLIQQQLEDELHAQIEARRRNQEGDANNAD